MKTALRLSNTKLMVVVLTLLVCCISATAAGQQLPDAIDRVRSSIVKMELECVYTSNAPVTLGGTGFLVSKQGYALTAAHMLTCPTGALASQHVLVGLPLVYSVTDQDKTRGNFKFIDAEVIDHDDVRDVAILKLSKNPFGEEIQSGYTSNGKPIPLMAPAVAVLSTRTLREGEPIAVSGFPLFSRVLYTNAGIIATTRETQYFETGGDGLNVRIAFDYYLADMVVNHGNSGGPVYDASGEVIGMVHGIRLAKLENLIHAEGDYNAHLAIIVPIVNAKALLTKHGIGLPSK